MKRQKLTALAFFAATLLSATGAFGQAGNVDQGSSNSAGPQLTLLRKFSYQHTISHDAEATNIAFDRARVYITSPDKVVLSAPSLDSLVKLRTIFQPDVERLYRVYVYDHVLYVLGQRSGITLSSHTFYQSTDQGQSFQAIDNGLQECGALGCYYLNLSELFVKDNLLFVNAGAGENLMLSDNVGETYSLLWGVLPEPSCYLGTFDINPEDRTVLLGGECSIEFAYLKRGVLNKDMTSFDVNPEAVQAPALANRKVNAIAHKPGTSLVLAANEGGLLRSVDGGQSFEYVFEYPWDGGFYPYSGTILFPRSRPDLAFIGGWDKGGASPTLGAPYLAYGTKNSTKWTDISYLLKNVAQGIVTQVTEDENGRVIVVVDDIATNTVLIYQIKIPRGY